jgi:hypothetical protein
VRAARTTIFILGLIALAACGGNEFQLEEDIPADLGVLVEETFEDIREALHARADCLEGLTVTHSWEMDDRANYDPSNATITLRAPATAAEFEFSLAHEVAHHLEETCPAQLGLRPGFLAAQGYPEGTAWFEGPTWEETPSEQFASALGQVLTGRPDPGRRVTISDDALALVAQWVEGS